MTTSELIAVARRHDHNWEAVAFELDSDPETCRTQFERLTRPNANGHKPTRTCADPDCTATFSPSSNAQKYCKADDCQRRRWAREKRQKTGHKPTPPKPLTTVPRPTAAPRARTPTTLADRYLTLLFEQAAADLTPALARSIIERLAGLEGSD